MDLQAQIDDGRLGRFYTVRKPDSNTHEWNDKTNAGTRFEETKEEGRQKQTTTATTNPNQKANDNKQQKISSFPLSSSIFKRQ